MATRQVGRVVVGVDDSLTGLRALRVAVAEARRRGAQLHAVRVWTIGALGGPGMVYLKADVANLAAATVTRAFLAAMGGVPRDVTVVVALPEGERVAVLTAYADRDDDLLVIGSAQRSFPGRLFRTSIARRCMGRGSCMVLAVPPVQFARHEARIRRAIRRDADTLTYGVAPTPTITPRHRDPG